MKRRAPISFGLPSGSVAPPRIDLRAAAAALRPRPPKLDRLLAAMGWLGSPPQGRLIPPGLAAGAAVVVGPHAAAWQLAAWGVDPAGTLLKRVVRRPRPPTALLPLPGSRGRGSGFPSTHVATYTGIYGFAAWLAIRRSPFLLPLAVVAAAPVVLIGPSRVRAGDHWLSDVVAGYALGAGWLAALVLLSPRDRALRRELGGSRDVRSGDAATAPYAGVSLDADGGGAHAPASGQVGRERPVARPRARSAVAGAAAAMVAFPRGSTEPTEGHGAGVSRGVARGR